MSCQLDSVKVDRESRYYSEVKEVFRCRKAIYGDQKLSFEKIKNGVDRHCEVFVGKQNKATSILVYKLNPVAQFENFPIYESLEVKTFMLIDPDKENFEEIFEQMLKRVVKLAAELMASSIHMTVSAKEPWTLKFLMSHEFEVKYAWNGKYLDGVRESLVSLKLRKPAIDSVKLEAEKNDIAKLSNREDRKLTDFDYRDRASSSCRSGAEEVRHDLDRRSRPNDRRESYKRKRQDDGEDHYSGDYKRPAKVNVCTLKRIYIQQIRDGKKTVEGRLAGGMFDRWKDGDRVKFICHNDNVVCKIIKRVRYGTFREMLQAEEVSKCLPECNNLERAVKMYLDIPRYKEKEKFGVYAFRLEVVRD